MTVSLASLRSEAVIAGLEAGVPDLPADAAPNHLLSISAGGALAKTPDVPAAMANWRGGGSEALLAAWQAFTNAGQTRAIVALTQAEYDAIPTKVATTLYCIVA
jgi:hypothetical protein